MNDREAYLIRNKFRAVDNPSEEDIFLYTEALDYLIYENKDPHAMLELGGYQRIAKRLHPDICPLTSEEPELMELFQKALSAYRRNDLKALRETETLINRFLKEHGEDPEPAEIENLPEKIADLEMEIAHIIETEPYSYKTLLEDPEAVEKKRSELEAEKAEYQAYKKELQAHLERLLTE